MRTHLQILKIANTSLTLLPSFQLPQLKTLNVSSNHLTFVAPETMANLSNVRDLDLSRNELATPPSSAWHSMHHLRTLNLAGNPISQYMNDSFLGLDKLEFLDVSDIPVVRYQVSIIQYRFFRVLGTYVMSRYIFWNLRTNKKRHFARRFVHGLSYNISNGSKNLA